MILIQDNTRVNLDRLAEHHYKKLVGSPLKGGIRYHAVNSLIGRIKKQQEKDRNNIKRNRFWAYLLEDDHLKKIIIARPLELKVIIERINELFGTNFFSKQTADHRANLTKFGQIVSDVFNYKNYRKKDNYKKYFRTYKILSCPYCNQQKIEVLNITNGITGISKLIALFQLDHFYPQSRYPYLSLSFFNLIPGCPFCNATLKSEKSFDLNSHFNPFHKRFDDYFKFELNDLMVTNKDRVHIDIINKLPHPSNAVDDFQLKARYDDIEVKREAYKILDYYNKKGIIQSNSAQIGALYPNNEGVEDILINLCDIPKESSKILNRNLGKLKRDLAIQLNFLRN